MFDVEKTKIIIDEFGKTKFKKIYPLNTSLESLVEYIKDIEEDNDRLRKKVSEYSKDEEIVKYKEEAETIRSNSIYMLDSIERKRAKEFSEKHYKKCGRAGYVRYIITPTGIGTAVEIECACCKEKKDISNLNNW